MEMILSNFIGYMEAGLGLYKYLNHKEKNSEHCNVVAHKNREK